MLVTVIDNLLGKAGQMRLQQLAGQAVYEPKDYGGLGTRLHLPASEEAVNLLLTSLPDHMPFDPSDYVPRHFDFVRMGEGGALDWHTDHSDHDPNLEGRRWAITYYLSDCKGGELEARDGILVKARVDRVVAFRVDSASWHRVRPVKTGNRLSLTGWLCEP